MDRESKSLVHRHPSPLDWSQIYYCPNCVLLGDSEKAWAGCKELDSDIQCKWVEAKQCLNILRQLGRTGILTLQSLRERLERDEWMGRMGPATLGV